MSLAATRSADAPRSRYSATAMALHWTIALLILANIAIGWYASQPGSGAGGLFPLHKSIGLSVLLLTLVRLGWRLAHPHPPYPATMTGWERAVATTTHWGFYVLTLVLPATGWIMVSAGDRPLRLWGLPFPVIGPVHALAGAQREAVDARMGSAHALVAWILLALVALHVAAALKHQFWNRDHLLSRILPLRAPPAS